MTSTHRYTDDAAEVSISGVHLKICCEVALSVSWIYLLHPGELGGCSVREEDGTLKIIR